MKKNLSVDRTRLLKISFHYEVIHSRKDMGLLGRDGIMKPLCSVKGGEEDFDSTSDQ